MRQRQHVRTALSIRHSDQLRIGPGVGASRTRIFDAEHGDSGFHRNPKCPALVGDFYSGGVHAVPLEGILLFTFVGITQLAVRLLAYTGVEKIGASRSAALQSISPLISATLAIALLHETTTPLIVAGTCLVVAGIVLVSWKPEKRIPEFHRWHLLLPVGAAFLTGMNHPIRRYVLSLANEPLFFSALMGTVSLAAFGVYSILSPHPQRLVWDRRALLPFVGTGLFETFSILCIITALSIGQVIVVAPIAASYPYGRSSRREFFCVTSNCSIGKSSWEY